MTKDTFINSWGYELSISISMGKLDAKQFLSDFYDNAIEFDKLFYGTYDGQRFQVGTKLTSLENGELIIAPEGTPDEEIVHIVKKD